ncbi:interleukin-27 receptor subunit alpha isoform X2 [Gouania willdenowi]|uniref:interleukin-27 receptor subunit alpha isoform X2 n=1 Tax=Gouania willdenowi TaxID=441366 RepID=UPI0010547141|nr:interleukin-27 receptor subunit alpha-like isoform X2 [Gouania willdenowi]
MVYLMGTLKLWLSLHGCFIFLCISTVTKVSACEAPSSPQCFRKNSLMNVYMCEWSLSNEESNTTFSLHADFLQPPITDIKQKWTEVEEEKLVTGRRVVLWVKSHVGNSTCTSPNISVQLGQIVIFEAPQNITVSWMENNLSLRWLSAEPFPASTEIWIQSDDSLTELWQKILKNTTLEDMVNVDNLLKNSSYQVKIRHQSNQVKNPLWSKWSPVVSVPAELGEKPEVTVNMQVLNGTRKLTLSWKEMPPAASVRGVNYTISNSQSLHRCPCSKEAAVTNATKYTVYASYSAVNISVVASNAAGKSPPTILQVPAEPLTDLKICDKTMLDKKFKKKTCLEWFAVQDADSAPINRTILPGNRTKNEKSQITKTIQDYVRYIYLEHKCHDGKPLTVKKCLFYRKEGAPNKAPQDFIAFSETHTSVNLSWTEIPIRHQRGFLTHYKLCSVRNSSQDEVTECFNVSSSVTNYSLENLLPETKYNISLARVTAMGEGPKATVIVNTKPEKPLNVWLSFGLLVVFFLFSAACTIVLKKVRNKIFHPVPTPIVPEFTPCSQESQEILDEKEEFHQVTLLQIHQEGTSVIEETEGISLSELWKDESGEDKDNDMRDSEKLEDASLSSGSIVRTLGNSGEREITDIDQMDHELSMLTYRNGLVFDVKTDSV